MSFFPFSFSGEDCFGTFPCINHGFECQSKSQYLSILRFHDNRYNNDTRFGTVVEFLVLKGEKIYEPGKATLIILVEKTLTASFFESGPMPTQPLWVQGIRIVPNGHILVGFAIGALRLATMATLHLRALHKTKTCSSERIFISYQHRLKRPIYYKLVFMAALLNVIYAK